MLDIQKVLLATDLSEGADFALPWAVRFAKLHGSTLHLLHAISLFDSDPSVPLHHYRALEAIYRRLVEHADQRMRAALENAGTGDLPVELAQSRGISAADVILDYALQEEIDLIVLGTHGHRGPRPQMLGSVSSEVARIAHCAVLAVGHETQTEIRRIVVPIDFSEPSDVSLEHAKELGTTLGASLHLLHVVEVECYLDLYFSTPVEEAFDIPSLKERAAALMAERFHAVGGPDVPYETAAVANHPVRGILEFAEDQRADLLIMASHGRTGQQPGLVGSVANSVLRRAPCPLLLLKAFGKSLLP